MLWRWWNKGDSIDLIFGAMAFVGGVTSIVYYVWTRDEEPPPQGIRFTRAGNPVEGFDRPTWRDRDGET